jgi:hypothetical protein
MLVTVRPAAPSKAEVLTALALAGKRHWGYPERWLEAWRELLIEADPNAEGFYLHMGAQRVGETVSYLTGEERVVPQLRYALPGTATSRSTHTEHSLSYEAAWRPQ